MLSRVFASGVVPEARPVVWRFLFGYHSLLSTASERDIEDAANRDKYRIMTSKGRLTYHPQSSGTVWPRFHTPCCFANSSQTCSL